MAAPMGDGQESGSAGAAHHDRLAREVRWLPCIPGCGNWLRYGIQPKDAGPGGLVFASRLGTPMDPSYVRRDFRAAIAGAVGVDAQDWTPRELRHSFVSLLSDNGVPLEEISRLVGHSSTAVTELVYRKQIRPVMQEGATVMDRIFHEA